MQLFVAHPQKVLLAFRMIFHPYRVYLEVPVPLVVPFLRELLDELEAGQHYQARLDEEVS